MQPEQRTPAKGRENIGQIADGQILVGGQVDLVNRGGELGQVVGALGQRFGLRAVHRAIRIYRAQFLALDW